MRGLQRLLGSGGWGHLGGFWWVSSILIAPLCMGLCLHRLKIAHMQLNFRWKIDFDDRQTKWYYPSKHHVGTNWFLSDTFWDLGRSPNLTHNSKWTACIKIGYRCGWRPKTTLFDVPNSLQWSSWTTNITDRQKGRGTDRSVEIQLLYTNIQDKLKRTYEVWFRPVSFKPWTQDTLGRPWTPVDLYK